MTAPASRPLGTSLSPGASAVIYGGVDATAVRFDGVAEALRVPQTELCRLGKPEGFVRRRRGVALAHDDADARARERAKEAAGRGLMSSGLRHPQACMPSARSAALTAGRSATRTS